MQREATSFSYAFELQPIGAAPDSWIPFLNGCFEPSPGVRRGVGAFHLQTARCARRGTSTWKDRR